MTTPASVAGAADPVIDARQLKKTYGKGAGRFAALSGVDFHLDRGESVAIVGKSGSGKSTLMHLLALLDRPDSGTLHVAGQDTRTLSTRETNRMRGREFGFVFQQFFLTPRASVLENVTLPLTIAGVSRRERKRRAMEVLTQFELADKAGNRANDLSGGQKQRVVLSRALVAEPSVVFADEPTGNLDSVTGRVVEDTLFALNRDRGISLVIVTHDEELAARCDRRVYLRDGMIVDSLAVPATAAAAPTSTTDAQGDLR